MKYHFILFLLIISLPNLAQKRSINDSINVIFDFSSNDLIEKKLHLQMEHLIGNIKNRYSENDSISKFIYKEIYNHYDDKVLEYGLSIFKSLGDSSVTYNFDSLLVKKRVKFENILIYRIDLKINIKVDISGDFPIHPKIKLFAILDSNESQWKFFVFYKRVNKTFKKKFSKKVAKYLLSDRYS